MGHAEAKEDSGGGGISASVRRAGTLVVRPRLAHCHGVPCYLLSMKRRNGRSDAFRRRHGEKSQSARSAILRNQHGLLTVASVLEGEYGLGGMSLGVPCILSRNGVEKVFQVALPPDEQSALVKSAPVLREVIEQLESAVASKSETERQ